MARFNLVDIWTDPEPGPAAFSPMPPSLQWLPDDHAAGQTTPAFVFVHGWGSYPYEQAARRIGPDVAARGFAFLSVCMRRRGLEGQLHAAPDDDIRDIKLAVDYLHTGGFDTIILVGREIGALSILRYQARTGDTRVAGLVLLEPTADPAAWAQDLAGAAEFGETLGRAGIAVRQGAGMDTRFELRAQDGPAIIQNAAALLNWWGQPADGEVARHLAAVRVPRLVLAPTGFDLPNAYANDVAPPNKPYADPAAYASRIVDWALADVTGIAAPVATELVEAGAPDAELFGVLWSDRDMPTDTAILLMHGLSSSPLSPLFRKMGPVLVRGGCAALAIESRRSGFNGHETALLDDDIDDIDAWIRFLIGRGYARIVLAGASMGSLSIGRYQSLRQNPNVVALAHLMPTADCPDWFRRAAGDGPYAAAVDDAHAAVARGDGDVVLIDVDVRQPPPSLFAARFRWTQRAASWLSWWGPDADSSNTAHIANANVPLLLLSGTDDSYNDKARFAELTAAAVRAPSVDEKWYPGIDHGLAGVERAVASDVIEWLHKADLL